MGIAEFQLLGGVEFVTGQGREVEVVVGLLVVQGVEGVRLRVLVAGRAGGDVVALNVTGIHVDLLETQADLGQPLGRGTGLPFAEQGQAVPLTVIDVPKGIGPHVGPGWRPPVIKVVALVFSAQPQQMAGVEGDVRLQTAAQGIALGVHRHPRGTGGADRGAGDAVDGLHARATRSRRRAIPEALVGTEVHEVVHVLVIDLGLEVAPGEVAGVVEIEVLLLVAEHVHALVGEELLGDVLVTELGLDEVAARLPGQIQVLVAAVIGRGTDHVQGQGMVEPARGRGALEVATRLVIP